MPEIGATLREARMRARIDVSEIEAQTKIRAKYLRAIENEEFDLLPGPTFVKSFLRTYAQALGLDPKPLLEEYRSSFERPSELEQLQPLHTGSRRPARAPAPGRSSLRFVSSVVALLVVIGVLLAAVLSSGGGGGTTPSQAARGSSPAAAGDHHGRTRRAAHNRPVPPTRTVSVQLVATAPVYVCMESADGSKPLDGVTLAAGERTAKFRSHDFRLTLGNNAVTLLIDGTQRVVPASATAISYRIDAGGRHSLSAGSGALPHCP